MIKADLSLEIARVIKNFPTFRIIRKEDSKLMRVINVLLRILTFGGQKMFMMNFTTTLGNTMYIPTLWDHWPEEVRCIILRHEAIHMKQAKKYWRPFFSFLYMFFPLPFLFAYFRMKFESEAYEESIRASYDYFGMKCFTPVMRERYVSYFTSSDYLWMWPFKGRVEAWYDTFCATLIEQKLKEAQKTT